MAKFSVEIDSDNSAFGEDGDPGYEIAHLLRETADKVENGYTSGLLIDSNGLRAGHWSLED